MERELHAIAESIETNGATESLIRRQADLQDRYNTGGGLTYRARTRSTLLGLGFSEEELARPISVMSGGQMRKAALAKILLSAANLLLLDEPTNHLDIASLEWLESYLASFRGAFVVISHDRYFLDKVCNRIFELENGSMRTYSGNYTQSMERKMTSGNTPCANTRIRFAKSSESKGSSSSSAAGTRRVTMLPSPLKKNRSSASRARLSNPMTPAIDSLHLKADALTANEVVVVRDLSKRFGSERSSETWIF
jgi:ATP-binding cassette subfamily F protein 3